ncbi:hypothetical protein H6G65_17840 [Microcystis elabens FACHB-917]|nr:hypothetical protein [Microcystis elabens FACHB-917]
MLRLLRPLDVCALLEIFHPLESVARQHIADKYYGNTFHEVAANYDRNEVIADLDGFLDTILCAGRRLNSQIITFKIFPGHLDSDSLGQLLERSSAVLFHSRNKLHSYISDLIATDIQCWSARNTSDIYPEFDKVSFLSYLKMTHDYLSNAYSLATDRRVPMLFSSYENLRSLDNISQQFHLAEIFSRVLGQDLSPLSKPINLPVQQDQRSMATEKISNSKSLKKFLQNHNAEELNWPGNDISHSKYHMLILGIKDSLKNPYLRAH